MANNNSNKQSMPAVQRIRVATVSRGITVARPFQGADTSDVIQVSQCFSGKEICILNGITTESKHELERTIVSGGGEVVQNPGDPTFCVIAEVDDIRVKSLRNRIKWDIVRPSWVFRCLALDRLAPYRPEDLMVATRATLEVIDKNRDE